MNSFNLKQLKIHPDYAGLDAEGIAAFMSLYQLAFCNYLIANDFNLRAAAELASNDAQQDVKAIEAYIEEGCTEKQARHKRAQNFGTKGIVTVRKPIVSSYLYVRLQELKKIEAQNFKRSFSGWVDELEDLRTKAKENDDYGTALRAHMNLGTVLGHTEGAPDVSKVSESELVKMIAGDDETLAIELGKKLGITGAKAKAIEGELVSK